MNRGICHIVGAGDLGGSALIRGAGDYVIAADGGYAYLKELGVTADLVLGDFDSLNRVPDHPNLCRLPREKDDTDTFFAVRTGLELGYDRFLLYGVLGGARLDHTLANIQTVAYLAEQGCRGYLLGGGTVVTAVHNGVLDLPGDKTGYLSVFCNSGVARGVDLTGLKYPLEKATLTGSVPVGTSNEFLGGPCRIGVEAGTLIVLWREENPENFAW